MNNVDLIIKYLSGDLNEDEAGSFEKELASNPALEEEFKDVSAAYKLIRVQLQKRDEDSFKAKLSELMDRPSSKIQNKSLRRWPRWYFLLPLAGSLAILLAVYLSKQGPDRILTHFFDPLEDPVVLAFNQGTRGGSESGIVLYMDGHYHESMGKMTQVLDEEPDNQMALLFYLLASMELNQQEKALDKAGGIQINNDHQLGQSLTWYTTMALIKSGRMEEAALQILPLTENDGPYQADACRLLKRVLK